VADLWLGRSSEGLAVAEAELCDESPDTLVAAARDRGAALLWVHATADLAPHGFARTPGYVRLHADEIPAGEPLPPLAPVDYAPTLDRAYRGLWGHKHVARDAAQPAEAVVVGLHEGGEPVGLCTAFPAGRLIDGPGLLPGARGPERYARLLLGACAVLGPGPADVDSWGDDPAAIAAYAALGFAVSERVAGWELRLR